MVRRGLGEARGGADATPRINHSEAVSWARVYLQHRRAFFQYSVKKLVLGLLQYLLDYVFVTISLYLSYEHAFKIYFNSILTSI